MDTITTPAGQYTVPATSIVHNAQVSLTDRSPASIVHLTQYDTTMPIIAVALTANGQPYTVPTGAAVNVRLAKSDGTYVYNPALGVSEDAQTAYIGTTVQMTTVWGRLNAIVEVVLNGAVAGTGIFILDITANPVPESAIESTSEFLTIQQIAVQVQQAADLLEQQSTNLQNLTDNLEAVQNAAANATSAAQSAAQAAQSAQQALGFRAFFDAISPDANGSLDPSRPMTTAAAQASWMVKSKGDRIQSVQVNGFTSDGQSGGLQMYKLALTSSLPWSFGSGGNLYFEADISGAPLPANASSGATAVGSQFCNVAQIGNADGYASGNYIWIRNNGGVSRVRCRIGAATTVDELKSYLDAVNVYVWYIPAGASQAPGLYIPIQAQGNEYRCQCLPITEALGVGDNVQSNVPSGCDRCFSFDGSADENWTLSGSQVPGYVKAYLAVGNVLLDSAYSNWLPHGEFGTDWIGNLSKEYVTISDSNANICVQIKTDGDQTIDNLRAILSAKALIVFCKSTTYSDSNQINAELETHASGAVYTHPAVELVAVPYTEADATAAQQLAATPSTLPYIDSADVPMMLDAAEPTAAAAPLASTLPVAGTYVVSSQDGTTVAVTLKAFQDGGDAATLGGMTAIEAMLNFVYPVGSIYMSANNVSPQTFLGGTWQQIQGQFLLAASGSYPAGSTGGAAQQTLATENIAAHNHGPAAGERFLSIGGAANGALVSPGTGVMDVEWNANWATADTGSGEPFSIMPPYLAVYMWQRTA